MQNPLVGSELHGFQTFGELTHVIHHLRRHPNGRIILAVLLNSDMFVENYVPGDVPFEVGFFGRVRIRVLRNEDYVTMAVVGAHTAPLYGQWMEYAPDAPRRERAVGLLKATEDIWFVRFEVAGSLRLRRRMRLPPALVHMAHNGRRDHALVYVRMPYVNLHIKTILFEQTPELLEGPLPNERDLVRELMANVHAHGNAAANAHAQDDLDAANANDNANANDDAAADDDAAAGNNANDNDNAAADDDAGNVDAAAGNNANAAAGNANSVHVHVHVHVHLHFHVNGDDDGDGGDTNDDNGGDDPDTNDDNGGNGDGDGSNSDDSDNHGDDNEDSGGDGHGPSGGAHGVRGVHSHGPSGTGHGGGAGCGLRRSSRVANHPSYRGEGAQGDTSSSDSEEADPSYLPGKKNMAWPAK